MSATYTEPETKAIPSWLVPMKFANQRPRDCLELRSTPDASQTWLTNGAIMEVFAVEDGMMGLMITPERSIAVT